MVFIPEDIIKYYRGLQLSRDKDDYIWQNACNPYYCRESSLFDYIAAGKDHKCKCCYAFLEEVDLTNVKTPFYIYIMNK